VCTAAFWHKTGARYRAETKQETAGSTTWAAVKNKVTLLCGVFFLTYVGAEGESSERSRYARRY
jgi:hypothetical protein